MTDKALELGKQLAAVLDEWDVLGRWMAHHVAELITLAEADDGSADTATAKSRAAQEILLLWSHRTRLPRPYPLESFDRVFAALDRLENPSMTGRLSRYFGDDAPNQSELAVVPLLDVAARLDDEVGDVVAWLIAEAVREAADAEARWVPIAMELGDEQSARALRKLMWVTRRRHMADLTHESEPLDDPLSKPSTGETQQGAPSTSGYAVGETPSRESTGGQSDEAIAAERAEALVDAIDQVIATLQKVKSVVQSPVSPDDV